MDSTVCGLPLEMPDNLPADAVAVDAVVVLKVRNADGGFGFVECNTGSVTIQEAVGMYLLAADRLREIQRRCIYE